MPSWFKQSKRADKPDEAESTIEVKAQVIADAVRAGAGRPAEQGGGIAADGLIAGAEFEQPGIEPEPNGRAADSIEIQLANQALAERIEEGLAAVGVTALRPDGQRFDPTYHEAGGTVATEDEALDGVVAETEVVGFSDRGELLRAPIVTVYNRNAMS